MEQFIKNHPIVEPPPIGFIYKNVTTNKLFIFDGKHWKEIEPKVNINSIESLAERIIYLNNLKN